MISPKEKYIIMTFFISMLALQLWVAEAQSKQIGTVPPLVGIAILKIAQHEEAKKALQKKELTQQKQAYPVAFVWYNPWTWF